MDNIEITKLDITNIVTELQVQKNTIDGYIKNLNNEAAAINNAWKGVDATLYVSKLNADYSVLLSDFTKCLQSYIDYLDKVFSEYEKHDTTYASTEIEVG